MSYIGKNPKVDSVKLDGSATEPSGAAADGQVYYNTGTGSISKGLKVYKNSQFVSIDKQLGDADTFHLLKASDLSTAEWSAARNSTSTSYLNQNAVPFETTTASGVAGTFSNSSTGDALLTDESADLVFNYKSSGTSDDAQEYFGIPLTVPKAFRGGNIVLSFVYRTENDGTAATIDNQFEVGILDKSTGNGGQTTSTNSTTDIAAGAAITVVSKTGLAVGQKIRLEAGSQAAIGSPDATVVEAYITEVSGTANEIKISEDWDTPHAAGAVVVSGWLTDVVSGQLPGADSDTDKQGKQFSLQFKTEDDTSDIVLWFQNKNTSSTDSFELFVDNILLSANKFLQASSQLPQIVYAADQPATNSYAANTGMLGLSTALMTGGAMEYGSQEEFDSYMTISGSPTKFEVHKDCEITFYFSGHTGTANRFLSLYKNTTTIAADGYFVAGATPSHGNTTFGQIDTTFKFSAGDYFALAIGDMGGTSTSTMSSTAQRCQLRIGIKPVQSDVILLESQEEIFTDWNSFDAGPLGFGTVSKNVWFWKRVGDTMEIMGSFVSGSPSSTQDAEIYLPSGYSIDMAKCALSTNFWNAGIYTKVAGANYLTATAHSGWIFVIDSTPDRLYLAPISDGDNGNIGIEKGNVVSAGTGQGFTLSFKVPIAGWNSNFNPLMSMPLVDIGSETEYFYGIKDGTSTVSYGTSYGAVPYFDKEQKNTVSKLGTITNTSAYGTYFTASQRVKVTAAYYVYVNATNYFDCGWAKNLTATEANAAITSAPDAKRLVVNCGQHSAYNLTRSIACTILLEPGETLFPATDKESIAAGIGSVSFLVERDNSNTNMAHIIKPAVAIIKDVKAYDAEGGGASSGSWFTEDLNTVYGESWFVTLASNKFTLDPGTYKIKWRTPSYDTGYTQCTLYDDDATAFVSSGQGFTNYLNPGTGSSSLYGGVWTGTITSSTEFSLQTRVSDTQSTNGRGNKQNNDSTRNSIYTTVVIEKLK